MDGHGAIRSIRMITGLSDASICESSEIVIVSWSVVCRRADRPGLGLVGIK